MARLIQEKMVVNYVKEIRQKDAGIGGEKLYLMYKREFSSEATIGRDKFENIIARNNLNIRNKKRNIPKTTDSTHGLPTYPNKVYSLIPSFPNQIWVSDITYIKIWDDISKGLYHFAYLSLITNVYSKKIVGWQIGDSLETCYPLQALKTALKATPLEKRQNLIHHSDRGIQYASYQYVKLLKRNNITISMTENGNPKHNAIAERINNTIKNELFKGHKFESIEEIKTRMQTAVEFYNNRRPHYSIGLLTPQEATQHTGYLKKYWKSYRDLAIQQTEKEEINRNNTNNEPIILTTKNSINVANI